jgi:hypothetical protein
VKKVVDDYKGRVASALKLCRLCLSMKEDIENTKAEDTERTGLKEPSKVFDILNIRPCNQPSNLNNDSKVKSFSFDPDIELKFRTKVLLKSKSYMEISKLLSRVTAFLSIVNEVLNEKEKEALRRLDEI